MVCFVTPALCEDTPNRGGMSLSYTLPTIQEVEL